MNRLRLGIRLESLGVQLRLALQEASRLGVSGVQVDAVGDLSPGVMSQTGRREFLHLLSTYNLQLTAVGCPLRHGLDVAQDQEQRIEHVRTVMTLSYDLGPRMVVIQPGRVPEAEEEKAADAVSAPAVTPSGLLLATGSLSGGHDDRAGLLQEALTSLARHGDHTGTTLALETGLESGVALATYLRRFDTSSLRVNYDPANLLMNRFDPIESARALHGLVVHVHAKDARASGASRSVQEVPLGQGDIDWLEMASVLEEIEYRGWLVIERESGSSRREDMAAGVRVLKRLVAGGG